MPARPAARPGLAAWRVPALTFEPAAALDLLGPLGEPGAGSSRAVLGGSVPYLAALARQAADLAARGRVLPALAADEDGGYAARWRPVLSGADAQRARDLAAAMPPLCRALDGASAASAQLLTDALDALADAAARARLGLAPGFALLPDRRGRRPARVPVAERWAAALAGADAQVPVTTPQDEAEAADLAAALDQWRAAAQVPAGPVRTCFRLVEPEAADPDTLAASTVPGSAGTPDTGDTSTPRTPGRSSSRCSRPTTPACCCPRRTYGPVPRRAAGRRPGSGTPRRTCSPGSARPPGCSPSLTRSCGPPPRSRSASTPRGRPGS